MLARGGAEKLAQELLVYFNNMDCQVAFVNRSLFPDNEMANNKIESLVEHTSVRGWQILKAALAFKGARVKCQNYTKVLFSGVCAPLAVDNCPPDIDKILYCHTPPRFIYDLKEYYLEQSSFIGKLLIRFLISYLQPKYESAIGKMDLVVANSKNVQKRLKKYLGVDSLVVYPPCNTGDYYWKEAKGYYLSTARLEPYKRVDLIIEAFRQMPEKKLIIASGGSDEGRLKELAKGATNIQFSGWCEPEKLYSLVNECIATLYLPIDEDFGISPVESMAAGKPVIGVDEGGVAETVVHGETGILLPALLSEKNIIEAVNALSAERARQMKLACEQRANLFSTEHFLAEMRMILNRRRGDELVGILRSDSGDLLRDVTN